MDILIKGPGKVTVCLVDRVGKTMLRETLRVFGSQTVSARRPIELELTTSKGKMPVSPILVFRGEQQTVTFDGKEPAAFTKGTAARRSAAPTRKPKRRRGAKFAACRAMRRPQQLRLSAPTVRTASTVWAIAWAVERLAEIRHPHQRPIDFCRD
jgi:hypothetical protein